MLSERQTIRQQNARVAQWWSVALPRRRSRVRSPSRASFYIGGNALQLGVSAVSLFFKNQKTLKDRYKLTGFDPYRNHGYNNILEDIIQIVQKQGLWRCKMSSIERIRISLMPVFKEHNVRKAILFGSYAKGTERANSDIDIFVDSGLKGLKFYGLLEDVATSLEKPVDLIDSSQVKQDSKVFQEINDTGIVIYER